MMQAKEKNIRMFTPEEQQAEIKKITKKKEKYTLQLEALSDKYIHESTKNQNKAKLNYKKIAKINKQRGHLLGKVQHLTNELFYLEKTTQPKLNFLQKWNKSFKQMPYHKQKQIYGILFLVPWMIGFLIFFASPMATTIWWSLNKMSPQTGGGFTSVFTGLQNYINLFTSETLAGTTVLEVLTSSVIDILIDLPTIIIFSIFIAVLLNTKFKGHQLVKAIFFIPVVYNMTVVNNTLQGTFGDLLSSSLNEGFQLSDTFSAFLMQIGIGGGLIEFLMSAVDRIFLIINKSGIQIIMFLAALQSIPFHLYESAKVEGATKYEMFWKVTIPMVSPMILTSLVYTIVDSFSSSDIMNFLTVNSQGTTMATNQPGLYSAISIIYFLINMMIIVIAFLIIRKKVFYYD